MSEPDKTISDMLRERQGKALSSREVQGILGYSKIGLFRLTQRGAIPHHRIGDRIKFDPVELRKWWEAAKVG